MTPTARRRPPLRRLVMFLRRAHLYFGLFLFPWAVLYGVTAFLFNHPTALPDQVVVSFGTAELAGTPLEALPTPTAFADELVARLRAESPEHGYSRRGEAKYSRAFAFATVVQEHETLSILIDAKTGTGTVRAAPTKAKPSFPEAPFATRKPPTDSATPRAESAKLLLDRSLAECIREAIRVILARTGFSPGGAVTITSVPDLVFVIDDGSAEWEATYNALTGQMTGVPQSSVAAPSVTLRRFLLRLHTAHGYPGELSARWYWAVVVDLMAFAMLLWGTTGLVMWWQIKATRRAGVVVLALSVATAVALWVAMRAVISQ